MPTHVPEETTDDDREAEPVQLTRDMIMAAEDLPMARVDVPEWGGFVYVRTLTALERDEFEDKAIRRKNGRVQFDNRNLRARLVTLATCNERGERLFQDGDAEKLGHKSSAAVDRIFPVAKRLSWIGEDAIDELEKNSEAGPAD
jgi:hypothetical protein